MFSIYEYLKRRFGNVGRDFRITMASNLVNDNDLISKDLEAGTECQPEGAYGDRIDQKGGEKDEIVITELGDNNAYQMKDVKAAISEMENRINAKFEKRYNQLEKLFVSK